MDAVRLEEASEALSAAFKDKAPLDAEQAIQTASEALDPLGVTLVGAQFREDGGEACFAVVSSEEIATITFTAVPADPSTNGHG